MFAVDLPRVRNVDVAAVTRGAHPIRTRNDLAGTMVVVIDDEAPILDATRTLLEMWGCSVVTAASGNEALKQLGSSPRVPDIVVCDYRLRGNEDGIGVTRRCAPNSTQTFLRCSLPEILVPNAFAKSRQADSRCCTNRCRNRSCAHASAPWRLPEPQQPYRMAVAPGHQNGLRAVATFNARKIAETCILTGISATLSRNPISLLE